MKMLEHAIALRTKEFSPSPLYSGEKGSGDEGWKVSNTLHFHAIPMLSATHPQPFCPEYRGEGSKNLFVVRTPYSNSPKPPRQLHFHQSSLGLGIAVLLWAIRWGRLVGFVGGC